MIRTNRCHLGPEFPIYSGPAISALPQCTMKPVHRFNALVSPSAYGRKGQEPPGWPLQDLDCSIQPLATSSNCDHAATPLFFSKIISINAVTVNIWSNYLLLFNIWGSQFLSFGTLSDLFSQSRTQTKLSHGFNMFQSFKIHYPIFYPAHLPTWRLIVLHVSSCYIHFILYTV